MSILIFEAEKEAGLEEQISKAHCISYLSPLIPAKFTVDEKAIARSIAEMEKLNIDIEGLYPTNSILASSVWNLNDDIFDKYEMWMARSTPVNKYTNNNHVESEIVGHMTGSWPIDENGNLIDDDIPADQLPDIYHIFNTAVIYTAFSDPELISRAQKLIKEIEAGTKFVSMEAIFKGFDYGIKDSNGVMQIVQRNEKTAFLTKHLRAYGGSGKYEDHLVGRLLRNITFNGKGYVDSPANPQSIIFDKNTSFNFISTAMLKDLKSIGGVYNNQKPNNGDKIMSVELEQKVSELTSANTTLTQELSTVKAERDTLKSQITELTEAKTSLEGKVTELTTSNTALQTQVDTFKANELKAKRVGKLTSGGYTPEEAETKFNLFANLTDDQFEAVANELIEAKKNTVVKDKPKAGTNPLDTVVVPTVVVTPTAPDASTANTIAGMATLFEKMSDQKRGKKKVTNNA
jgi:FtsZ-binding cell division protein ZapB